MTLGKYTVPAGAGKAGSDDSLCKGKGKNGLQKDFESAVNEFLSSDDVKSLGYHIEMGYSGYVSSSSADKWAKGGNGVFKKELSKFGWGLGWEITRITKDGTRGTLSGKELYADSAFREAAKSAGLSIKNTSMSSSTDTSALVYLYPNYIEYSASAEKVEYDASSTRYGDSSSSSSTSTSGGSIAAASYFFANQFNAVTDAWRSQALQGIRALANDEPLWNYVKKAVNASLRACSSDPDGNFIAWYPDYFGKYGLDINTTIDLIELQDLTITQSDKEFYSHVFCPGVDITGNEVDMLWTQGVVAIESDDAATADQALVTEQNAANASLQNAKQQVKDAKTKAEKKAASKALSAAKKASDNATGSAPSTGVSEILSKMLYIPEGDEWKYSPSELYRRYGARPAKTQSLPNFTGGTLIEDAAGNQSAEKNAKGKKSNTTGSGRKAGDSWQEGDTTWTQINDTTSEDSSSGDASDSGSTPEYILPYLYALYEFMYHWANQYQAKIQVTFMPEVFPGSRVRVNLPSGKYIEFYVQSVTHNMSYTSGFTTQLGCICPRGNLVSGMIK